MEKWKVLLYRLGLKLYPAPAWVKNKPHAVSGTLDAAFTDKLCHILRSQHVVGAQVAVFDDKNIAVLSYGDAVLGDAPQKVTKDTYFRIASISKLVTALAAFRLSDSGKIDLDTDISPYLGFELRHPAAKNTPITLRRLMSHTAGVRDGSDYIAACRDNRELALLFTGDCFTEKFGQFEYSNLGAGLVACVLEGMLGKSYEAIMQETVFAPMGFTASFYPQTLFGALANGYRVLPPKAAPLLNSAARRAREVPTGAPDPKHHYLLAQGNLYITAGDLAKIGQKLMQPRYAPMRKEIASFGARAHNLSEGLGTFIVRDKEICPQLLYGHQGLSYGAVNGLFFDPAAGRGFALLTSGCSEARLGVLADINIKIMKQVFN